jgi:hypothetical protein
MPDSLYINEDQVEKGLNESKEIRDKKKSRRPDRLAIELAREWNSPGDWFHQHLYVE